MAWVKKRTSGAYQALYRDLAGRERSAGTFRHKAEALRRAGEAEINARNPLWKDPNASTMTWGQWVEIWWPTRTVEPGTLSRQFGDRRKHLDPRWKDVRLCDITRMAVSEWAISQREKVSATTVQRHVHLLSASLNAAVDEGILQANPAARLKLAPPSQGGERYLTRDEVFRVLDVLEGQALVATALLVGTGLRFGEMAGLHVNRWHGTRVDVVESYDRQEHRIKAYPKSRKLRTVPVPQWLRTIVEDWLETSERTATCGLDHPKCRSGLLVPGLRGAAIDSGWYRSVVFLPALAKAGVAVARPHDLRHTYASWLIQDGIPLTEVQALLGHSSIVTTQRYQHLSPAHSAAVLHSLGQGPAPARTANGPQPAAIPRYAALRAVE